VLLRVHQEAPRQWDHDRDRTHRDWSLGHAHEVQKPLEIEYHDQEFPHTYVVRMAKRDYVHILDAVKTHVGIDAEILGNADKRKK